MGKVWGLGGNGSRGEGQRGQRVRGSEESKLRIRGLLKMGHRLAQIEHRLWVAPAAAARCFDCEAVAGVNAKGGLGGEFLLLPRDPAVLWKAEAIRYINLLRCPAVPWKAEAIRHINLARGPGVPWKAEAVRYINLACGPAVLWKAEAIRYISG
jgi:hypothetical protein